MPLTALGRALEALEDLRRRAFLMLDQIQPGQRHVEVDREVVRHFIALADWGLGAGAKPSPWAVWIGRLRPDRLLQRVDLGIDRINAIAQRLYEGGDGVELAWLSRELDELRHAVRTASRRLSDQRRFVEAAGIEREFDWLRGELLTVVLANLRGRSTGLV